MHDPTQREAESNGSSALGQYADADPSTMDYDGPEPPPTPDPPPVDPVYPPPGQEIRGEVDYDGSDPPPTPDPPPVDPDYPPPGDEQ